MENLPEDYLNYPTLLNRVMREFVRECLISAAKHGLLREHHFFISFLTSYPDVIISDKLLKKYPQEITIVLQYQFEDLEVLEDKFKVRLSFDGVQELVQVPFSAISSFADPSKRFAIQLTPDQPTSTQEVHENINIPITKEEITKHTTNGNVITLNQFRKRNGT